MKAVTIDDMCEELCAGCGICMILCPSNSIKMVENERGFLTPLINQTSCIECGLCKKTCPESNEITQNDNQCSYGAISRSSKVLNNSTSGGLFSELAQFYLKNDGIVCGCSWENGVAKHICIKGIEEIEKLQKSKYVQSNITSVLSEVKEYLRKNIKVLFCGTGCQIAGLKSYLVSDYDNLLTVEVACHGVPSPGLYRKYIEWLEKRFNKKIKSYTFRNKKYHKKGEHYKYEIIFYDGTIKSEYINKDPYYSSFIQGKILRKTCYNCKYKNRKRISDITLGDFWGAEKELINFPAKNGVSAVLINSSKGAKEFKAIQNKLIIQKTSFEKVVKHNKSLLQSTSRQSMINYRIDDIELMDTLTPSYGVKSFLKNHFPEYLKYFVKKITG